MNYESFELSQVFSFASITKMPHSWVYFHLCLCMSVCMLSRFSYVWLTRLLCPWDSPGKNTGVGCHFLLRLFTYIDNDFPVKSPWSFHETYQVFNLEKVSIKHVVFCFFKNCDYYTYHVNCYISSVQLLSHVRLFATPWAAACQASLSNTISRSPPKLMYRTVIYI